MEKTVGHGQIVIDHGDLLELAQSAEAWAGQLRVRASTTRKEFGALPMGVELEKQYTEAADRIDQAIARARKDALNSAEKTKTKV